MRYFESVPAAFPLIAAAIQGGQMYLAHDLYGALPDDIKAKLAGIATRRRGKLRGMDNISIIFCLVQNHNQINKP